MDCRAGISVRPGPHIPAQKFSTTGLLWAITAASVVAPLELPRFRGQFTTWNGGCHDAENVLAIHAGVLATDGRVLDVSASGYYAWCKRSASTHASADRTLLRMVRTVHQSSRGTYGAPRIHAELHKRRVVVSCKRVARLMRAAGITGVSRRRWIVTTKRASGHRSAPDLVQRDFTASRPNQLWVADITYIPTWPGFLYLAVVLDA